MEVDIVVKDLLVSSLVEEARGRLDGLGIDQVAWQVLVERTVTGNAGFQVISAFHASGPLWVNRPVPKLGGKEPVEVFSVICAASQLEVGCILEDELGARGHEWRLRLIHPLEGLAPLFAHKLHSGFNLI